MSVTYNADYFHLIYPVIFHYLRHFFRIDHFPMVLHRPSNVKIYECSIRNKFSIVDSFLSILRSLNGITHRPLPVRASSLSSSGYLDLTSVTPPVVDHTSSRFVVRSTPSENSGKIRETEKRVTLPLGDYRNLVSSQYDITSKETDVKVLPNVTPSHLGPSGTPPTTSWSDCPHLHNSTPI